LRRHSPRYAMHMRRAIKTVRELYYKSYNEHTKTSCFINTSEIVVTNHLSFFVSGEGRGEWGCKRSVWINSRLVGIEITLAAVKVPPLLYVTAKRPTGGVLLSRQHERHMSMPSRRDAVIIINTRKPVPRRTEMTATQLVIAVQSPHSKPLGNVL